MQAPARILEFSGGRCACGRLSLMLSRCPRCIRAEAAIVAECDESEPEEAVVAAVGPAAQHAQQLPSRCITLGAQWLPGPARLISSAEVVELATTGRVRIPDLSVDVQTSPVGKDPVQLSCEVPGKPCRITFVVSKGVAVLIPACVETSFEWISEVSFGESLPDGSVVVRSLPQTGSFWPNLPKGR